MACFPISKAGSSSSEHKLASRWVGWNGTSSQIHRLSENLHPNWLSQGKLIQLRIMENDAIWLSACFAKLSLEINLFLIRYIPPKNDYSFLRKGAHFQKKEKTNKLLTGMNDSLFRLWVLCLMWPWRPCTVEVPSRWLLSRPTHSRAISPAVDQQHGSRMGEPYRSQPVSWSPKTVLNELKNIFNSHGSPSKKIIIIILFWKHCIN